MGILLIYYLVFEATLLLFGQFCIPFLLGLSKFVGKAHEIHNRL